MSTTTYIYDLNGKLQFSAYIDQGKSETQFLDFCPLRDLLIMPADLPNKRPYLQDRERPHIEDFHQGGMCFSYDNSYFLSDILDGEMSREKMEQLQQFFQYQNGMLQSRFEYDKTNSYIILVPDDYGAEKQEKILNSCNLRRGQTLLLWRSIAACLGAEEYLKQRGARDGELVAVIDVQNNGRVMVSVLTLKQDGDFLVPCRKAFVKNNASRYWSSCPERPDPAKVSKKTIDFWRHTYNRAGRFVVPEGTQWTECSFSDPVVSCSIPSRILAGVNHCIVIGSGQIHLPWDVDQHCLIWERDKDFCAIGAGRFTVRQRNGLPTYFDECEPLIFIIQDISEETIVPVELIPGNEFCKGGTEIVGKTVDKYYLEKENSQVNFLLNVGDVNPDTHLKELIQEFGHESVIKQKLILHPTMIPGQGIARVEVEAVPLLQENIQLDFLNMQLAYDQGHPKTIAYLQKTLKRSYPIDMPDVEASHSLWNGAAVNAFLMGGRFWDSEMFAKSQWPYAADAGIRRFQRVNVFGTNLQKRTPFDDDEYFNRLFQKIADDFQKIKTNQAQAQDYIRLAAWTYQAGNPVFQPMVNDVLMRIKKKAESINVSTSPQDFTLCANLLTHEQQINFIHYFASRCKNAIRWAKDHCSDIRGVDNWLRAFSEILMHNSDILRDIDTPLCYVCWEDITVILDSYTYNRKNEKYVKIVIKSLLFLLKRRKYDRSFMRDENSKAYMKTVSCCREVQGAFMYYGNIFGLTEALIDFMEGKGTLEGIPIG